MRDDIEQTLAREEVFWPFDKLFDPTGVPEDRPDLMAVERRKFKFLCDKMVREGKLTLHGPASYGLRSRAE